MNKKRFPLFVLFIAFASFFAPDEGFGRTNITHATGTFEGKLDANIFYQYWKIEPSKAIMVLVHGFGEHSDRYTDMANHFSRMGLSIYTLDHRGHGRSDGPRWNPESFDYYIDDLKTYIKKVKAWESEKKIFMLGHSLGGEIALKYTIVHGEDLEGVIVSAPVVGSYLALPSLGRKAVPTSTARLLGPVLDAVCKVIPNAYLPGTQINPHFLNHDPKNYMAYANDPIVCHEPMKLRLLAELSKNMVYLQDHASNLQVPCLIMCGSKDMLVPPDAVKAFHENLKIEDKTFIMYQDFYHEIFNEIRKDQVYADVDAWLLTRLQ